MSVAKEQHDQIVSELLNKYKKLGYQVETEPSENIKVGGTEYRPDLVAKRGDETLVIEVKISGIKDEPRWAEIASTINARPGWRFILVLASRGKSEEYVPPNESELRKQIDEARRTIAISSSAAFLLSWALFEAVARLALFRISRSQEKGSPASLVSAVASIGLISPVEEIALVRIAARRNRVAHGDILVKVETADIEQLLDLCEALLKQESSE